jgi:hypothetical protein
MLLSRTVSGSFFNSHSLLRSLGKVLLPAILIFALFSATSWASTGYPNEITNIVVSNVTTTTVDITWDTLHLSTSQVVLARDMNYQGERRIPANPDPQLVNHHRVTIDRLMPYDAGQLQGTYYFYVASTDVNQATSTAPGPFDSYSGDPKTVLLQFHTAAPDPNAKSNYTLYTFGPTAVYAGSDLYFEVQKRNWRAAIPTSTSTTLAATTTEPMEWYARYWLRERKWQTRRRLAFTSSAQNTTRTTAMLTISITTPRRAWVCAGPPRTSR